MTTVALLSVDASPVLVPSMLLDIPYAPSLLLDAHLGSHLTDHPEFVRACRSGFDTYFEVMYEHTPSGDEVFVEQFYTSSEVSRQVCDDLLQVSSRVDTPSLSWRAGFVLGWLSALALVQRYEALKGLELLCCLVEYESIKDAA